MRRHYRCPPTGNSLTDTLVYVEADDGSQALEGVIVDGQRDADGAFDLDAEFTSSPPTTTRRRTHSASTEQTAMPRFSEPFADSLDDLGHWEDIPPDLNPHPDPAAALATWPPL